MKTTARDASFSRRPDSWAARQTIAIVPRHVLGGPGRNTPPSEKNAHRRRRRRRHGRSEPSCVGGREHRRSVRRRSRLRRKTLKTYPKAKVYSDYREMLDKQKDNRGRLIATPDHTHAVISMAAMRAGKHVYCQKPLTHTVYEARALAKAARECGVVTQMGIQGPLWRRRSVDLRWIWAGLIGEVREVDAWCDLTYYPWGHAYWSSSWSDRPKDTPAVPPQLNWDLWIGPAPMRPYHRAYHPSTWRCFWDFGCGMMGRTRRAFAGRGLLGPAARGPDEHRRTSCGATEEVHPLSAIVTYQFPARADMPPLKLTWYEGTRPPRPAELEMAVACRAKEAFFQGKQGLDHGRRL